MSVPNESQTARPDGSVNGALRKRGMSSASKIASDLNLCPSATRFPKSVLFGQGAPARGP